MNLNEDYTVELFQADGNVVLEAYDDFSEAASAYSLVSQNLETGESVRLHRTSHMVAAYKARA